MGFDRGEIRVKAMDISVMDGKKRRDYLGVPGHEWGHYCYRECPPSLGR